MSEDYVVTMGSQLSETLMMLDHPYPNNTWLSEIVEEKCSGREGLDEDDFQAVVRTYEERLEAQVKKVFSAACRKGSDVTSAEHIPQLLRQLGVPLMIGAEGDVARESEAINFDQFVDIFNEALSRAGLSESEHTRLTEIFEACEEDGMVTEQQLRTALSWQEYLMKLAGGKEAIDKIVAETVWRIRQGSVTPDPADWGKDLPATEPVRPATPALNYSDRINAPAFFAAARVLHERVVEGLRTVFERLGLDPGGTIRCTSLVPVIEEIGFIGAVQQGIDKFRKGRAYEQSTELTFPEACTIVVQYSQAEGLSQDDVDDIRAVFDRFDVDCSGTLGTGELGPVIRWLGYQPSQYRIYDFCEEVGLTEDSLHDLEEFKTLVARYLKNSLEGARSAFQSSHRLKVLKLDDLLKLVGYEPTEDEIEDLMRQAGGENATFDFREFKWLQFCHRQRVRQTMMQNGGFTSMDYEKHRDNFKKGDVHGRGYVEQKVMREILNGLFPSASYDRGRHVRIGQMVKDADFDGNGTFDFEEFMWLMRKVTEEEDRIMLVKGLQLKTQLGYKQTEVKQFRELYKAADEDMSGDIDFEELQDIFANIVNMTNDAIRGLKDVFQQVDDGDGQLDFWEFLGLMRKLQDVNWCNLNGIVNAMG